MAKKPVKGSSKNSRKKKKKRRLRKPIRMGLWGLAGILVVFFAGRFLFSLFSSPGEVAENSVSVTETTGTDKTTEKTELNPTTYDKTGETIATVLIDPGHGGYDSGKLDENNPEIYEKDINLEIAKKVASELERINPNIEVILTRTSDEVPWPEDEVADLTYREEMQTLVDADYFLSLHCNADDYGTGGYIFFLKPGDEVSMDLAQEMSRNFGQIGWSELHSYNTTDLLQVVTNSKISSILLEMGFMTNEEDMSLLLDEEMTDRLATAIAQAYSDYIMAHPNIDTHHSLLPEEDEKTETDTVNSKEQTDQSDPANQDLV